MKAIEKGKESLVVMDGENHLMVSYTTDENGAKTAFAIPNYVDFAGAVAPFVGESLDLKVSKTGVQKDIIGFTCEGYELTTEDGMMKIYVTDDIEIAHVGMLAQGAEIISKASNTGFEEIEGVALYTESYNTKGKLEEVIQATAINPVRREIQPGDYEVFSGFGLE